MITCVWQGIYSLCVGVDDHSNLRWRRECWECTDTRLLCWGVIADRLKPKNQPKLNQLAGFHSHTDQYERTRGRKHKLELNASRCCRCKKKRKNLQGLCAFVESKFLCVLFRFIKCISVCKITAHRANTARIIRTRSVSLGSTRAVVPRSCPRATQSTRLMFRYCPTVTLPELVYTVLSPTRKLGAGGPLRVGASLAY